jgi:type II secretory pathway pseudopilin PulG
VHRKDHTDRTCYLRLGVWAAVAVPRLGNTIESSEESAEEAVIGNFRSAIELYAMDKLAEEGNKSYPYDPFDALDNKTENSLQTMDNNGNSYWEYSSGELYHYRDNGDSRSWNYDSYNGELTSNY